MDVIRQEGVAAFLTRGARNLRIRGARIIRPYHYRNVRRWQSLRGWYRGQRAFLVGNGPSLNVTPLHLLAGEHTICFNRFNLMYERLTWRPTMYMNVDGAVALDMAAEIPEIIEDVQYAFLPDVHSDGIAIRAAIGDLANVFWLYPDFKGFYDDLPHVGLGGTVAYAAMQVLVFLGFSTIYLLGVDASYQIHTSVIDEGDAVRSRNDDDPNHFDPRYFGTGRRYHQPDNVVMARMTAAFDDAARQTSRRGVGVLNVGVGGRLTQFPRGMLRHVVRRRTLEWELCELAKAGSGIRPVTPELLAACSVEVAPSESLADRPLFALTTEEAMLWATRLIRTHVPLGPVADGRSFFIARPAPLSGGAE